MADQWLTDFKVRSTSGCSQTFLRLLLLLLLLLHLTDAALRTTI